MVAIFAPDESVPLPYLMDMLKPADSIKQSLLNFAFYDYYFYGYPFFAFSGLVLLPLKALGLLANTSLVMAVLRQAVSLLPILAAILLLVYLQTEFKSYKAIVIYLFMVSVPAVVQNNFWWHPDGLVILLMMLAILFLNRDNLRFSRDYYLTAAMCGFAAGTKGIGFYFFLSVLVYLLYAYFSKKITLQKVLSSAALFIIVMALAYLLANPILIFAGVREQYFIVMREQSRLLTLGYEVIYETGWQAAWPVFREHYRHWLVIPAGFAACLWGLLGSRKRLLYMIILTWAIPTTIMVFFITHFKFQYWLPVALPLFSCLAVVLPHKDDISAILAQKNKRLWLSLVVPALIGLVFLYQFLDYIPYDIDRYQKRVERAENNASILFYDQALQALQPLPQGDYYVLHDVLMYVPPTPDWVGEGEFHLLDHAYIASKHFDILMILKQRIADYTNPNVQGIDPQRFTEIQQFYQDAGDGTIPGYQLIYRNDFGLIYVSSRLYDSFFHTVN